MKNPLCQGRSNRRGSALIFTLVVATALLIIVASLLSVTTTHKRLNRDIALTDEARNAAEGAMEVAAAEFDRRAVSYGTLPINPLSGFTLPSDVRTALSQGHVQASSIEFKAGNLSPLPTAPEVIDASDPFNAPDPDKGKPVNLRHAYIYGKATATDPRDGHAVTSYVSTLVQVRTQSWLNYGVFGNLDLEFHAGPAMSVLGPVHCNQNLYLLGGSELGFYSSCTTTKKIYRKFKDNGSTSSHTGAVKFAPKANPSSGEILSMSTSQDSRMTGFKEFAESRWKGFVQDVTFDVTPFNPPGMLQYVEDDYTTTSVNETRNHAYAFVEPQLATVSADNPATGAFVGHKGTDVENLKVSAVAGLVIRIKPTLDWPDIGEQDNDDPDFDPGFELLFYTSSDPSRPPNRSNFPLRGADGRPIENIIDTSPAHMSAELRNRLFAAVRLIEYKETATPLNGNRDLAYTQFRRELHSSDIANADAGSPTSFTAPSDNPQWYPIYDRRQGYVYPNSSSSTTNSGLRGAYHTLHIDLARFDSFLNAAASEWEDVAAPGTMLYNPAVQWSGVLYVQLPLEPYTTAEVSARASTDKIRPARLQSTTAPSFAVVLRNAKRLPAYSTRRDDGFVFGTNGPVYVLGHYNADGNSSTGSSTQADPGPDEIPAVIAADAVTLLSQNYANDDTYFRDSAEPKKNATFTEFSTAVFAGVVPTRLTTSGTGTNGQRMGGVHNFVRFLENWGGCTYRYRGSLALLFESEVATRPYYEDHHPYWYSPPTRDIGYHIFFASGRTTAAWPPFMRSDRRIKVDRISAADYAAGPPTPP